MALAVVILVGCASATPTPINSIEPLVGKWSGTLDQGGGLQLFYLTINPDSTLVASWDGVTRWGKVTIEGGRARFNFYIWSGNLDYLEGSGDRVILLNGELIAEGPVKEVFTEANIDKTYHTAPYAGPAGRPHVHHHHHHH